MSWTNLPPELVDKVLSDNGLRKRDLANLARVNRSTYPVVLEWLYRDVKLHGSGQRQDQQVLNLFDRALTESPRLAATTKSLTINAFLPNEDKLLRSKSILGKLYALQTLSLAFYGQGYFDASFVQKIIPTGLKASANTLAQTQCIEISDPELTFGDIVKLMWLPKVQSLSVKCHRKIENSGLAVLPSTASLRFPLKNLTVAISADCNQELLNVLPFCFALESFTCNVSSMCNVNDDLISPAGLSQALMPCQKTLIAMEFNSDRLGHIDDSRLDLSCFGNLRSLKANSLLLFGEDEGDDPACRNGLYARLPSSLEKLEILFASDTSAFKSLDDECDDEGPENNEAIRNEIEEHNLTWLIEVARYRQSLSLVRIEEETRPSPSMRMHNTATLQEAPPQVKRAFHEAEIEIELYLRPPCFPTTS